LGNFKPINTQDDESASSINLDDKERNDSSFKKSMFDLTDDKNAFEDKDDQIVVDTRKKPDKEMKDAEPHCFITLIKYCFCCSKQV